MKNYFTTTLILVCMLFSGCTTMENPTLPVLAQEIKWHNFEKSNFIGSFTESNKTDEVPFTFKNYEIGIIRKAYVGEPIIEYATGNKTVHTETTYKNFKFEALVDITGTKIRANKIYDYEGIDSKEQGFYIKATDYEYIKVNSDGVLISNSLIFSTGREYKKIFDLKGRTLFSKVGGKEQLSSKKIDTYSLNSIKQELIYNGKSGSEVKILYREFSGDLIRPAFTQVLQYDLRDGNTIRYKKFKIQIFDANNEQIKYKIVED